MLVCKFIRIEDLAANALIELIEKNNSRRVEFHKLIKYGYAISSILHEKGDEVILLIQREYTNELIRSYSDFFTIESNEEYDTVVLKEEKTAEDLRNRFRAFLSLDFLLAFTDKESLYELGIII